MAKGKRKIARNTRAAGKRKRRPSATQGKTSKMHARASGSRASATKTHRAPPSARKPARAAAQATGPLSRLPYFLIDAFTKRRLRGNPAAVVILPVWLPDDTLQAIAIETSAPATAFVVLAEDRAAAHEIRWFTVRGELPLCGHGTLAAAHAVTSLLGPPAAGAPAGELTFATRSRGHVSVQRLGELYVLDFPASPGTQIPLTGQLSAALGVAPTEVYRTDSRIMAVYDNRRDVYALTPDLVALEALDAQGIIVTAPGASHDFVSRTFLPKLGLGEDHVTGSSHCTLIPYWARRLNKKTLFANQVSRRGGELMCEDRGDRVRMGGHAITTCEGFLKLE